MMKAFSSPPPGLRVMWNLNRMAGADEVHFRATISALMASGMAVMNVLQTRTLTRT